MCGTTSNTERHRRNILSEKPKKITTDFTGLLDPPANRLTKPRLRLTRCSACLLPLP